MTNKYKKPTVSKRRPRTYAKGIACVALVFSTNTFKGGLLRTIRTLEQL